MIFRRSSEIIVLEVWEFKSLTVTPKNYSLHDKRVKNVFLPLVSQLGILQINGRFVSRFNGTSVPSISKAPPIR